MKIVWFRSDVKKDFVYTVVDFFVGPKIYCYINSKGLRRIYIGDTYRIRMETQMASLEEAKADFEKAFS